MTKSPNNRTLFGGSMDLLKQLNEKKYKRIRNIIAAERSLVGDYINLIGSTNYPFQTCVNALSEPLQYNPAEGNPRMRFFPGCSNLDDIERYGEDLALDFYNTGDSDYLVNLQPHSGTQANHIVINAVLEPNDVVLAQSCSSGGHISHTVYSKKFFNLHEYGVREDNTIDYEEIQQLCGKYNPKLIIAGTSSYTRQIRYDLLGQICKENNCLLLADLSHSSIYVHTGNHISPFGIADFITMTTNKTTRGIRGGMFFAKPSYRKSLDFSTCPLTQAAPKYNEILAKTLMFIELNNYDTKAYVARILSYSKYFSEYFISRGKKVLTNGTDNHLVMIDLSDEKMTGREAEDILYKNKILANRNQIPNDTRNAYQCSGLRFGFLGIASLEYTFEDCTKLTEHVYKTLFEESKSPFTTEYFSSKYHLAPPMR